MPATMRGRLEWTAWFVLAVGAVGCSSGSSTVSSSSGHDGASSDADGGTTDSTPARDSPGPMDGSMASHDGPANESDRGVTDSTATRDSSRATDGSITGPDGPAGNTDAGAADTTATGDVVSSSICVPCMGHIGIFGDLDECTQVKDPAPGAIQGLKFDLPVMALSDGTCMIGGISLECGGHGTFADTTPLTWTLANGVVTFEDSTRIFTCVVQ